MTWVDNNHKVSYFSSNLLYYTIAGLLAVACPYLTASGNYTALFLIIGSVIGIALFSYPVYCFWLLFYSVFLMGSIVSNFPQVTSLRWGVVLLSLILGMRTVIEFLKRGRHAGVNLDKGLFIVINFVIIAIVSSIINGISIRNILISAKNYFQFIPVIFVFLILPKFKEQEIVNKIIVGLVIVAFLQVPTSLYEVFYTKKIIVGDAIRGTFPSHSSGILSLYLIFCAVILISLARHRVISWRKSLIGCIFFSTPIFFNETKISFIYIFIVLAYFLKENFKIDKIKSIVIAVIGFILLAGLGYSYKALYSSSEKDFKRYIDGTYGYNFGKIGHGIYKLNRSTVLTFWFEKQKRYGFIPFLIGHGLNSANEGDSGVYRERGQIAAQYIGYGIGLTTVSTLLWETGVAGTVYFFYIFLYALLRISSFLKRKCVDNLNSAILLGIQIGIVFFCIEFFYNPAFIASEVSNFLGNLILGLTFMMTQKAQETS
jgi:hypothetical protein